MDIEQYVAALPADLPKDQHLELSQLAEMGLPPVASVRALSVLFGFTPFFMGALRRKPERYYRIFKIPKGKTFREIQAPRVALKVIQKWLAEHLSKRIVFEDCVYGFVPGRSAIDAAAAHCGAKWVYSADIKSFFPSVRWEQVQSALHDLGYSSHAADLITDLCCYQKHLAQGSPASPVLSNLVFKNIDTTFSKFAQENSIRFTRYADDLVFSGTEFFPNELPKIVRTVIEANDWQLADGKEHFSKLPFRLQVHGLLVHHANPRLTKGYRNLLRAFRHLIDNDRVQESDISKLKGHLAYAKSIDKFPLS